MLPFVMLPRPLQESNVVGKGGTAGFLGKGFDPYTLFPEGDDLDLTKNEVFAQYLVPGTPTYVGRSRPTVKQAIEVIHAAGGLAVWAHPYWDVEQAEGALREFAADGLDGVEAFYVTHTEEQTRHLHALARELGLITTGSADFHGPAHDHFNRFRAFRLHGLEPDLGRLLED